MKIPSIDVHLRWLGYILCFALLTGCQQIAPYFPSPTPGPTFTPYPTQTITPSVTVTVTPTVTATPIIAAQPGTPMPIQPQPIAPENADQLVLLAHWGLGIPRQVAWSLDGARVAVASSRGVYLYQSSSLMLERHLEPGPPLRSVAFAPDDQGLAAGAESGLVFFWDAADKLHTLIGHSSSVLSLAFSPDGVLLASGAWDGSIRLWDTRSGNLRAELASLPDAVRGLAFSPDGKTLFSWARRDQLQAWPAQESGVRKTFYVGLDGLGNSGTSAAFSSDGSILAVDQDYRVRVFHTANGTSISLLSKFKMPVEEVLLSPDGSRVLTLDKVGLKFWQSQDGKALDELELPGPRPRKLLISYSPDGQMLLLLGEDWSLITFQDGKAHLSSQPAGFQSEYELTSVPEPDQGLIEGLLDSRLFRQNLRTGTRQPAQPLARLAEMDVESLAFSADRSLAALSGSDAQVLMVDMATGKPLKKYKDCHRLVNCLAFSPDQSLLAAACAEKKVRLWDLTGGKPIAPLNLSGESGITWLAFTPEGALLAVQRMDEVQFWRVTDWQLVDTLPGWSFALSPKDHLVALALSNSGQPLVRIQPIGGDVLVADLPVEGRQLAFSPDGRVLAVLGAGLTLWQVQEGKLLVKIENPGAYTRIFFSLDGRLLVLGAGDGVTAIYGVP